MTIDLCDWQNVLASCEKEYDNARITAELLEYQLAYLRRKINELEKQVMGKKGGDKPAGVN